MTKPAKGIFAKLRRTQVEPLPEPELEPQRLTALRQRAAVAENPDLVNFNDDSVGDDNAPGRGLQPVVLVRKARDASTVWTDASSWFGGLPKLGAIAWPQGADGRPLPFAAQVAVADIAAVRPDSLLPAGGSLAFFLGEGAVIHVPEGVTQFSAAPADLPLAYDEGGHAFPEVETLLGHTLFPFWPVEPVALILPPDLRDPADAGQHDAIRSAMEAALPAELSRRGHAFDAAALPEHIWGGPVPVWWHGVDHFIVQLSLALDRTDNGASDGQRDGLSALIGALDGFAADRDLWAQLTAEEREVFAEALENAWQQFDGLLHPPAPRRIEELATLSLRAMIAGDAEAFAALPEPVRDLLNHDYRLPVDSLPQMFGLGADIGNAGHDHLGDVLLLQLPYDDMAEWRFGDNGTFRFWIGPEALAERNWGAAELTFDTH
jgi:hypothetical protein